MPTRVVRSPPSTAPDNRRYDPAGRQDGPDFFERESPVHPEWPGHRLHGVDVDLEQQSEDRDGPDPGRAEALASGSQTDAAAVTMRRGSGMKSAAASAHQLSSRRSRNEMGQPCRPASQIRSPPAVNIATRYAAIRTEFATPSSRVLVASMVYASMATSWVADKVTIRTRIEPEPPRQLAELSGARGSASAGSVRQDNRRSTASGCRAGQPAGPRQT